MHSVKKEIAMCKHPNSRKTIALNRQLKKVATRQKKKVGQYVKQNILGEKILWFRDNLEPDLTTYTAEGVENLINKYLARFDSELEQIKLKHTTGNRKNRQHASREDIINLTKKRELEEFSTCGIEIPDLLNPNHLKVLREWNGELRYLQNLSLCRLSKKLLSQMKEKTNSKKSVSNDVNMDIN